MYCIMNIAICGQSHSKDFTIYSIKFKTIGYEKIKRIVKIISLK